MQVFQCRCKDEQLFQDNQYRRCPFITMIWYILKKPKINHCHNCNNIFLTYLWLHEFDTWGLIFKIQYEHLQVLLKWEKLFSFLGRCSTVSQASKVTGILFLKCWLWLASERDLLHFISDFILGFRQFRSIRPASGEPVMSFSRIFHLEEILFPQKCVLPYSSCLPEVPVFPAVKLPLRILHFSDLQRKDSLFASYKSCYKDPSGWGALGHFYCCISSHTHPVCSDFSLFYHRLKVDEMSSLQIRLVFCNLAPETFTSNHHFCNLCCQERDKK